MEEPGYALLSEQWCCVEKSVKGMESRVGLWEIAVLQCAAFRVLHANIPITLELTNKYKKLFPIYLKTIAFQHIENFITDKYRFVMNAKNHGFISFIIKVILIFSYSYKKCLNIFYVTCFY